MLKKRFFIVILALSAGWTSSAAEPFFQDGRTAWKIWFLAIWSGWVTV